MRHPDENSSAFNPAHGWCVACCAVFRVGSSAARWWGLDGYGPFCSIFCMRRVGAQGTLPDHVEEYGNTAGTSVVWRVFEDHHFPILMGHQGEHFLDTVPRVLTIEGELSCMVEHDDRMAALQRAEEDPDVGA